MDLTPEDRHRVYEEEKARLDADAPLQPVGRLPESPASRDVGLYPGAVAALNRTAKRPAWTRMRTVGAIAVLLILALGFLGGGWKGAYAFLVLLMLVGAGGAGPVGGFIWLAGKASGNQPMARRGALTCAGSVGGLVVVAACISIFPQEPPKPQAAAPTPRVVVAASPDHYKLGLAKSDEIMAKSPERTELRAFKRGAKAGKVRLPQAIKAPTQYLGQTVAWNGRVKQVTATAGRSLVEVTYYEGAQPSGSAFVADFAHPVEVRPDDWVAIFGTLKSAAGSPVVKGLALKKIPPMAR